MNLLPLNQIKDLESLGIKFVAIPSAFESCSLEEFISTKGVGSIEAIAASCKHISTSEADKYVNGVNVSLIERFQSISSSFLTTTPSNNTSRGLFEFAFGSRTSSNHKLSSVTSVINRISTESDSFVIEAVKNKLEEMMEVSYDSVKLADAIKAVLLKQKE